MHPGTAALVDNVAVPVKAICLQRGEDQVSGAGLFARRINVLNTNKPESVVDPGLQIAGYGGYE
jgi:hypothetical protein